MNSFVSRSIARLGPLLLAVCGAFPPQAASAAEADVTEPGPAAATFAFPPDDPPGAFLEPEGRIELGDALRAVLTGSPRLAAFSWESRAREAEELQAGARPNPVISAELENALGSGEFSGYESAEVTLALSQVFELGGKRSKRKAVWAASSGTASLEYEIERVSTLAEATRRFVRVLSEQHRVNLAQELVAVSEATLEAVSRRVEAGGSSPVERSRARVELETSRIDLDGERRDLATARQSLAAMWGRGAARFTEAAGDLEPISVPPTWDALHDRIESSPELRWWLAEMGRRQADLALERARGVPDLGVGAGVRSLGASDDHAFVFSLGLPLPLFDGNRAAAQASELRISKGEAEREARAAQIEAELAAVHQELVAAHAEATALGVGILPEAQAAFTTAQEGYRQGLMRLTDVLDTERTLFELRGRHVGALARYHTAVADIEQILGAPLAGPSPTGEGE